MKHLRRFINTPFSENAYNYWRVFHVLLILLWSVFVIWRVASGSILETPDTSPTLIKIGLLEAFAFLTAWSLLLITLTTKIANYGKDISHRIDKSERLITELRELKQHDITETEELKQEVTQLEEKQSWLNQKADELAEENERLRRQ